MTVLFILAAIPAVAGLWAYAADRYLARNIADKEF